MNRITNTSVRVGVREGDGSGIRRDVSEVVQDVCQSREDNISRLCMLAEHSVT
jgi:hypothetical protein